MTRSTSKWTGQTDDTPAPQRVRVRVFERDGGCCRACGVKIRAGMDWQCDHVTALVNGGANTEANLQLLCGPCHTVKTATDVAEKATSYRKRSKHIGAAKTKRPMMGSRLSPWKHTMSGEWVRRET